VTDVENVRAQDLFLPGTNSEFDKNEGGPAKAETESTKSLELEVC
jgi:hypothetical protein